MNDINFGLRAVLVIGGLVMAGVGLWQKNWYVATLGNSVAIVGALFA